MSYGTAVYDALGAIVYDNSRDSIHTLGSRAIPTSEQSLIPTDFTISLSETPTTPIVVLILGVCGNRGWTLSGNTVTVKSLTAAFPFSEDILVLVMKTV